MQHPEICVGAPQPSQTKKNANVGETPITKIQLNLQNEAHDLKIQPALIIEKTKTLLKGNVDVLSRSERNQIPTSCKPYKSKSLPPTGSFSPSILSLFVF